MSRVALKVIPLRLKVVRPETHDSQTFIFEKPNGFTYIAGQYARWRLDHPSSDERGITRPFTISSSPTEPNLSLTTKFTPDHSSSFKNALRKLVLGSEILFEGPKGEFILPEDPQHPVVFLGGGVGITPFRSMVKSSTDTLSPRNITLIYANKTPDDIIYRQEFDAWNQVNPHFRLAYAVSRPDENWESEVGHLTPNLIKKYVSDLGAPTYYICGPEAMIDSYVEVLTKLGVTPGRILIENFSGY
jgi:ferredoxin-NADP reductase